MKYPITVELPATLRPLRDVHFSPGRAVYLFSVDGVMRNDPEDDGRTPNGRGSEYSVRHVALEPMASTVTAGTERTAVL